MNTQTEMTLEQIADKLGALKVGQSMKVSTDGERRNALLCARVQGKRIVTKASKAGGFTVTALPGE